MVLILLLMTGLFWAVRLQAPEEGCLSGSCNPHIGDLMMGRAAQLSASSTCGLDGPQNYCIIGYLEEEKKCFSCDSTQPFDAQSNPNSHRIENVITTFEPERKMKWWQSENGVHEVSIRLDLETIFQFSHLVLTFKSFRPAAMLVERSQDSGRTWKVFRYFSEDCLLHFPQVPKQTADSIDDVVCDSRYSGSEPSTEGEVVLKALDPIFQIENPYAPHIQELITMTNLRINFTRLFTLGDTLLGRKRRDPQNKYYYALYDLVVRGSCFCNGHAALCTPAHARGDVFTTPGMVHGQCVCQHNTAGFNCERCKDMHYDSPWRPGGEDNANICRRCNCHGHSDSCHFDAARFDDTRGVSGGVCDNCRNNREGDQCERCVAFTFQDPQRAIEDPSACIPCDCSRLGSESGGLCDVQTGQCLCKENVEGQRCDRCKTGHFGLRPEDPLGCQPCSCHPLGSTGPCDVQTGSCQCDLLSMEPFCDRCVPGHYGLANGLRCGPCDCDFGGAVSTTCDSDSGQCTCLPNMDGRQCSEPRLGYFLPGLDYLLYEAELAAPIEWRPPAPPPPEWNPAPATAPPPPEWNPAPATDPPLPEWYPAPATDPPLPEWYPAPATDPPLPEWYPAPATDPPLPEWYPSPATDPPLPEWYPAPATDPPPPEWYPAPATDPPPPEWNPAPATAPPPPEWNLAPATDPPPPIWNPVPATAPPPPEWYPAPATAPPQPIWNPVPATAPPQPIWNPVPATAPISPIWNPAPATAPPQPIWNPAPGTDAPWPIQIPQILPKCEQYYREQGYDFKISNGRVVLVRRTKRNSRRRRQYGGLSLEPGTPLQIIPRERVSGQSITWTGLGLVRVQTGAGLRFTVDNLPLSMDYQLVLRYEPESPSDWLASLSITTLSPRDERCNSEPLRSETMTLTGNSRATVLDSPVCLNTGGRYFIDITFNKKANSDPNFSSHILIDSLGLIPSIEVGLVQGWCSQADLDSIRNFRCIGLTTEAGSPDVPEVCEGLVKSMSARIHKGALSCGCNSEGSLGPYCSKLGGVCECRQNVIGRCCDSCASLTYGFGPDGCKPCECDPRGSESEVCDQVQGQCACRQEVSGRRCDRCQPGYWGFPHCRVCECNTLSEICDQDTGHCIDCRGHSSGPHCERCIEGFYGSPVSRVPCEPCLCPDLLQSGRFFALSCEQDPESQMLSCRCNNGHSGAQCERCSPGYFGDLLLSGARCVRCECNGNIDPNDAEACDGVTGLCLRCLYNTGGRHCEECRPGYYGSATDHDCKECSCDRRGTEVTLCPLQSPCFCDAQTGQCPCRSGARGALCDECEDGYWNIHLGCVPCSCDLANAMSNVCDKVTGQCPCQTEYGGRKCDECGENHFGNPDLQCVSCECNLEGTLRPSCDSETGECNCRIGVKGIFCDECALGYDSAFPECKECHACAKHWGHHVTDVERAAQTMRTLIPSPPNQLRPGAPRHQQQLRTLFFDLDQMKKNTTKPTTPRVGKMEVLFQKIMKLKNSIDPNCILLDQTPLLNTEIDNIGLQFRNLLSRLRNKVENQDDEDDEDTDDLLEDIAKSFELFQTEESRVKNATNAVEDSASTRQEVKHKLSACGGEGLLGPLEKKVKDLNVINFNKQICGGSGVDCSDCGGALCVTWLLGRKCGGPDCDGIVSQSQDAIETATNTHDSIKSLPLKIQEARDKMERVNRTALETKTQSKDMQDRINSSKESFEKDKDQIKELIKRVKDYLLDNLLPAEDVEKMALAVLNINPPRSPEHIRAMIQELTDLMNSTANPEKDLTELEEEAKAAHELKDRAQALKNRTKDINVSDIRKDIYDAEKAQDKANDDLDTASVDRDSVRDLLQEMKDKVNEVASKLMDPRLEDMKNEIDAVKSKTEQIRKQALEAQDLAESALNNAFDSVPALNDLLEKFDELKDKKSNHTQDSEAAKQLDEVKKEAEALKREVEDKLQQIEDLERWIEELNKRGQDKTAEVVELLKTADFLRESITRQAEEYFKCS